MQPAPTFPRSAARPVGLPRYREPGATVSQHPQMEPAVNPPVASSSSIRGAGFHSGKRDTGVYTTERSGLLPRCRGFPRFCRRFACRILIPDQSEPGPKRFPSAASHSGTASGLSVWQERGDRRVNPPCGRAARHQKGTETTVQMRQGDTIIVRVRAAGRDGRHA
jgi:hypothetical protein